MGALHALREVNTERIELAERNKELEVRVRELQEELGRKSICDDGISDDSSLQDGNLEAGLGVKRV